MAKDILLGEDFDLLIDPDTGDFAVGESSDQHTELLLHSNTGEWVFSPEVGADLYTFFLDETGLLGLRNALQAQIEADGGEVRTLEIEAGAVAVQAKYV